MEQQRAKATVTFTVMCVLTILGNLFLIVVNLLKVGMLAAGIQSGGVGSEAALDLTLMLQLVLVSCLGAIVGAALMLNGMVLGFRIYAASIVLHLVLAIWAMLLWAMTVYFIFVSVIIAFYCVIPLIFLRYFRRQRSYLR